MGFKWGRTFFLGGWRDAMLSVVFPSHCALCQAYVGRSGDRGVCPACWSKILPVPPPLCRRCGLPLPAREAFLCGACRTTPPFFQGARAYGLYQQELRDLIHLLKFGGRQDLAKPLGDRMAAMESYAVEIANCQVLIPVPLHPRRLRRRGFNQSELLAKRVACRFDIPVYSRVLFRKKDTPPQSGLTDHQRRENVHGAFLVRRPKRVAGKRVLLVDDVLTTGATLNACTLALLSAGAAKVHVLTLARVPHLH